MNKIGYKEVSEIELSSFSIEDTIIYNKYYKNELMEELNILTFNDCIFEKCTFTKNINNSTFTNCKFINCDFSNINIEKCGFYFVTIIDSKLVGTSFIETSIRNSIIKDNLANMLYFTYCKLNNINIENNNMINSTLQSTKLNKVNIIENKMNSIEIIDTRLNSIDLSSNDISGIKININDIKNSIISYEQVYDLINLLEIKIK